MKFRLGCRLNYQVKQFSTFIFNIQLQQHSQQQIDSETLQINPQLQPETYVDESGNRYFRLNVSEGTLQVTYNATVLLQLPEVVSDAPELPAAKLPLETLPYLYPSRYCQSDRLIQVAQAEFGDLTPGYSRVAAIADWIYHNITYQSGSTDPQTSAFDTVTERAGVCRDFAHLGITFCRALNIPARFVAGYAYQLDPPDFHACFEAYLGDRWHLFDATRLAPTQSFIRIGSGRDAVDVSFATLFGPVQMEEMAVFVEQE